MTRADLEAFVTRHVEAFRQRDPAALASHHALNGVIVSPIFSTKRGRPAIEDSYRDLFTVFPDWTYTVEDFVVDPPRLALLFKVSATHRSDFLGLPGTGKRIEFSGMQSMEFEDGLVALDRRIYDFTAVLVELGILRAMRAKP